MTKLASSPTKSKEAVAPKTARRAWKTNSFDLDKELYVDLNRLVAYNKIMRLEPDTITGVVTQALNNLFAYLQVNIDDILALKEPSSVYAKKLAAIDEKYGGYYTKKSFALPAAVFDDVQRVLGYNAMFELPLRKASEFYRVAVRRYIDAVEYDFRPPGNS